MNVILVVGPSGSGKDTLLRGAMQHFYANSRIHFVKRYITRKPDTNEDNYYLDREAFTLLEGAGFFISTWQAHNNCYGIAHHCISACHKDATLVCSVSRSVIRDFEIQCDNCTTIFVTAAIEVLKKRLQNRGREEKKDIEKRLSRAKIDVEAKKLITFDNSEDLEHSMAAFNALLKHVSRKKSCEVS